MEKNGKFRQGRIYSMNENLSRLVNETSGPDAPPFTESDLDLPDNISDETQVESKTEPVAESVEVSNEVIPTTNLSAWFNTNGNNFENVSRVAIQIRGVDSNSTLIVAVDDPSGQTDSEGHTKRLLRLFEGADIQPVLNIPAEFVDVYNTGFQIVHPYDNMIIKTYGLRTGLIVVFCHIDPDGGRYIPYAITRIRKKDEELSVIRGDSSDLSDRLNADINKEAAQLLYKQCTKVIDTMGKNCDLIDWLLKRQEIITDINHHLQIDNVIVNLLGYNS
jgi:hypothetical protein